MAFKSLIQYLGFDLSETNRLPTKANERDMNYPDVDAYLKAEGRPGWKLNRIVRPNTPIANNYSALSQIDPAVGFLTYIRNVRISTDRKIEVEIIWGEKNKAYALNSYAGSTRELLEPGTYHIPINSWARTTNSITPPATLYLVEIYDTQTVKSRVTVSSSVTASGTTTLTESITESATNKGVASADKSALITVNWSYGEVYDDPDDKAPFVGMWISGSSLRATPAATVKEATFMWKVRQWFRQERTTPIRIRFVSRQLPGTGSEVHAQFATQGVYDGVRPDFIFIQCGNNDTDPAVHRASYRTLLNWAKNWATTKVIVIAPHLAEYANKESLFVQFRQIEQEEIALANSPKILYMPINNVNLMADELGVYNQDGSGLHLLDKGQGWLMDGIGNGAWSSRQWLNENI